MVDNIEPYPESSKLIERAEAWTNETQTIIMRAEA
jgi:hypothetical protein